MHLRLIPLAVMFFATAAHADPIVRLIIEEDGKQAFALRCLNGNFTIAHDGKGKDAAAAIIEREGEDGELTPSGVITCRKRKD